MKDDWVTSNMALDRYQSMFAIATYNGMIKIFNLKGYETDIQKAHDTQIVWLTFVPNQGILISIDVQRILKMWDLRNVTCIASVEFPI